MSGPNKHGLSRYAPEPIRREVRQRCGFGCVLCGTAIIDYEHFDPDFADATEHRAEGMTLLCPTCNQKRKRGVLSVDTVRQANNNPRCLQQGFSSETFDFGSDPIQVFLASNSYVNCRHLIVVKGQPLLSAVGPEERGSPYRLSGVFADASGRITVKIEDNVWSAGIDNWDVECVGQRTTIRNGRGDIGLILVAQPPRRLIVERLQMYWGGVHLQCRDGVFSHSFDGAHWSRDVGCSTSECFAGMVFE